MKSAVALLLPLLQLGAAFTNWTPHAKRSVALAKRDTSPALLYPEYNYSMPVDHFFNETKYEPHCNGTFDNRYWFDDTYYKPGGPVFLVIVGESVGTLRLPIMQKGIAYQLSKAFGGMSVVIEHRYFGTSFPTADLSVKNLRFLTTDQALADVAYFAQNIVFKGHEHEDLTSKGTQWITYGGSYAGAFVAFLRKVYPHVFYGAISSSGVTEAIWDYWQYYQAIAHFAPAECMDLTKKLVHMVDNILMGNTTGHGAHKAPNKHLIGQLKSAFGLSGISHNKDFASALSLGMQGWQSLIWDPTLSSTDFPEYCGNISSNASLYANQEQTKMAHMLLDAGGYKSETAELTPHLLNYFGWTNQSVVQPCTSGGETLDECYSTYNQTFYNQEDVTQYVWRSWPYMYCTQWGFLQTGSGVPKGQLPVISRTIDLEYSSIICRDAFGIKTPPDVHAVNRHGGFNISYPKLAIIGGEWDPWRPSTPLSQYIGPWHRANDTSEPFLLIPEAIHHWDEYGLFPNQTTAMLPPETIKLVQSQEYKFVKAWLSEVGKA